MFNEKPSREEILAATQVNDYFYISTTHTLNLSNKVEENLPGLCQDSPTRNAVFSQLYE